MAQGRGKGLLRLTQVLPGPPSREKLLHPERGYSQRSNWELEEVERGTAQKHTQGPWEVAGWGSPTLHLKTQEQARQVASLGTALQGTSPEALE